MTIKNLQHYARGNYNIVNKLYSQKLRLIGK